VVDAASSTTTITVNDDGVPDLRGPFSSTTIPVGSPIVITSETASTELTGFSSFVTGWNTSTGVITFSPALPAGTDATGAVIITASEIKHSTRLIEAINRALTNHCSRWQKVPLTFVPDGELLGAVASFWTASAGTASYQSLASPETVGQALQISHSSAANAQSNTIPCRPTEEWEFFTAIRATTDGDTATFSVQDITNSAEITVSYSEGSGSTTGRGFVGQKGQFTVPATCDRIAFRLAVSGSGTMTAQMAPIIAFPKDAATFPFTNRVLFSRVGNFFRPHRGGNPTGPEERRYTPLLQGGRLAEFSDTGDHLTVTFNFSPGVVYYDELVFGSTLSAMSDTTVFPLDQVVKWTKYELYKMFYNAERPVRNGDGRIMPSAWKPRVNEAFREASRSAYEPEFMQLAGRR
jgi:hypothetical protein